MFAPRNTAIQTAEVYPPEGFASIERALRRLSPVLARAASETAQAFFPEQEGSGPDREAQALSGSGTLRCSQANIGESCEMVCGLAVDKMGWTSLLADSAGDLSMDVLRELANCICGSLLSDPEFLEEFGQMYPCVPSVPSLDDAPHVCDGRGLEGAVRISGTWIHFTFTFPDRAGKSARIGRHSVTA